MNAWKETTLLCNRQAYFNTKLWKKRRKEFTISKKFTCKECGFVSKNRIGLHVHHTKYEKDMGKDKPENCVLLCLPCHLKLHKGRLNFKNGLKSK